MGDLTSKSIQMESHDLASQKGIKFQVDTIINDQMVVKYSTYSAKIRGH